MGGEFFGWFCFSEEKKVGKIELICMTLGMESRALHILGKNSVTELNLQHLQPRNEIL